jgi:hypothetical protein
MCCSARRLAILFIVLAPTAAPGETIWIEGEKPAKSTVTRHPWYGGQIKRELLSGGDFLSHWDGAKIGEAEYRVVAPKAGDYGFWVRVNPVQAKLDYKLNGGEWAPVALDAAVDRVNIAGDDKVDLRFLAWIKVGTAPLRQGDNAVAFRMSSKNNHHGMLDCFVFTTEPFTPQGTLKPGEAAKATETEKGWFAFAPPADVFKAGSAINLRDLNEKMAGDKGRIGVKGSQFIHSQTGESVRFWAVNGPPGKDPESLRRQARLLAKYGVNLARIHHGYYDQTGNLDPKSVRQAHDVVAAMKAEGIYTHFSIYFPLWLKPAPDTPWLPGYDGTKHPFAALYFNEDFQAHYREWWMALLLTPHEKTGHRLVDDPSIMGLEIINEDSYFFWTFNPNAVPDAELKIVEGQFGAWVAKKYGSIEKAQKKWDNLKVARDNPGQGRVGFRPLFNLANDRTLRDRDTAHFLLESQRGFYEETAQFLRGLGFKGLITCSNWATANPQYLGPIEKYSYTVGDFIDRHGYFGCRHKGENAEWSIRDGHTYADRSALRFDPEVPGKSSAFIHPAMDPSYDNKPSMNSETTWNRPNRYRSEAPLYYAAYGALQDSDAIVHFAFDGDRWSVKPNFWMQPWTVMSPSLMGQFPAAALMYRKGLVATGELLVDVNLKVSDVLDLKGTPLPQDASFDELRLKDVPKGQTLKPGNIIDPLVHYAGRTNVNFTADGGPAKLQDLSKLIDRAGKTVTSSTGELRLDYGNGVLAINSPAAQGVSGSLKLAGKIQLKDLSIMSNLDLGHIVAVSLDGAPLATSKRILLQAMSEEKPSGFRTAPAGEGFRKIVSIGRDPWLVRDIGGVVRFHRSDAAKLKAVALDHNGYPVREIGAAAEISLLSQTLYYLITSK